MASPVPVRDLGKFGIIKDLAPFDLPVGAWSDGRNVLFQGNRVTSGPVLRNISNIASVDSLAEPPVLLATAESVSGFDPIIIGTRDFRFRSLVNDTLTNINPAAAASISDEPYTTTLLGGILYVNRPDFVPYYYDDLTPQMKPVPAWDASWRARAFRSFKDFGIALSVTKGASDYPTMVKWSNATSSGSTPPDWDTTLLSSLAGENVITEATGQLVDGGPLKNEFVIYSNREAFLMEYIGAPLVFSFRKLFADDGVMSANCFVEVQGRHFVFGQRDIYVNDGISKRSIADNRVRRFIFDRINQSKSKFCFTFHSPTLTSVFFCYPTTISEVLFPGTTYCNEAAVYNYASDTWTFLDVPNISSMTMANVDSKLSYATASISYEGIGGTYAEQEDTFTRHVLLSSVKSGTVVSESRVLGLDDPNLPKISKPSVTGLSGNGYVTRSGITLESLGMALDARKFIASLYPLVQANSSSGFSVAFGRSENPDSVVSFETPIPFDPKTQYKVDTRTNGRFLSTGFNFPAGGGYYLSGYDVDIRRLSIK